MFIEVGEERSRDQRALLKKMILMVEIRRRRDRGEQIGKVIVEIFQLIENV